MPTSLFDRKTVKMGATTVCNTISRCGVKPMILATVTSSNFLPIRAHRPVAGERRLRETARSSDIPRESRKTAAVPGVGLQRRRTDPSETGLRPHDPPAARDGRVCRRAHAEVAPATEEPLLQTVPVARSIREIKAADADIGR